MIYVILSRAVMGRIANTRKEDTHDRIVEVAARAIRQRGYAGVGVADVMKEAGLTHGGFYAHFDSREALMVEALERARRDAAEGMARVLEPHIGKAGSAFRMLVEVYLRPAHLAGMETGCLVAALSCDMPRQSEAVLEASRRCVDNLIAQVRAVLPESEHPNAAMIAGTLIGTLQIARILGDNAQGLAVLAEARKALIEQYAPADSELG
jgi:TetR/AcrR family transcriptional regulator, transcriptional repressor for nem operon